jgi:RNA polymerase sigma factor (sigma-70 family)
VNNNKEEHIGLIYSIAFKLIQNNDLCRKVIGNNPDEYLGIGYIALQKAKNNYNPKMNVQFSTYATQVITDQVVKYARKNSTLIKVASAYRYQAWRVANGKEQTQGNQKGIDAAQRVLDGKMSSLALLSGTVGKETDEDHWIKQEHVQKMIRRLEERTRRVLMMRFGLFGHETKTLQEIGDMMEPPLSRERVRQIEKDGLTKLKKML